MYQKYYQHNSLMSYYASHSPPLSIQDVCSYTHMIPNISIHIHTMYLNNTNSLQLVGWTHVILLYNL